MMRAGTDSPAVRFEHWQSFAGHPQAGQILPASLEYTNRPFPPSLIA
jgi:hypothetical protein